MMILAGALASVLLGIVCGRLIADLACSVAITMHRSDR